MALPQLSCDINQVARNVEFERVYWSTADQYNIPVFVRRDDLIDTAFSGNKFYKLWGHLSAFNALGADMPVASFGGAYSNHLYALAAAGRYYSFDTVGVVRGEKPKILSPTLTFCQKNKMRLHFVSRREYKEKTAHDTLARFDHLFGAKHFWIPEGGSGERGILGAQAIGLACGEFAQQYKMPVHILTACATATTFCGIVKGIQAKNTHVIGVPVLKTGQPYLQEIRELLGQCKNPWSLWQDDGHCGGYAKFPNNLRAFMLDFERDTDILLDPIYTAKLIWSVDRRIKAGYFKPHEPIIIIHSGGLQGRSGFADLLQHNKQ